MSFHSNATSRYLHSVLHSTKQLHQPEWAIFFRHVAFPLSRSLPKEAEHETPIAKLVSEGICSFTSDVNRKNVSPFDYQNTMEVETGNVQFYSIAPYAGPWRAVRDQRPIIHVGQIETQQYLRFLPITASCIIDYPLITKRSNELVGVVSVAYPYSPDTANIAQVHETLIHRSLNAFTGISGRFSRKATERLSDIIKEVNSTRTSAELLKWCVHSIPRRVFEARNASIFTPITDDTVDTHLVLRCSSYHGAVKSENQETYSLAPKELRSLTQWVASHECPLRISLPPTDNATHFIAADVTWSNTIQDAAEHKNYLACPIHSRVTGFLGVLRIVEKERPFNERDETLLRQICEDIVAPKLHALLHAEIGESVVNYLHGLKESAIALSLLDEHEFANKICARLYSRFAARSRGGLHGAATTGVGKVIVINRLIGTSEKPTHDSKANPPLNSLKHVAICGDSAALGINERTMERIWPLEHTASEYAIMNSERVVYVHQRTFDKTRVAFRFCPNAKCVMGVDISFGHIVYGTIMVFSDALDISPDIDGTLLELLALQCAEFFYRNEVAQQALAGAGLRHDVLGIVNHLEYRATTCLEHLQRIMRGEEDGTTLNEEWVDIVHWNGMVRHYIECLTRRADDGAGAFLKQKDITWTGLREDITAMCRLLQSRCALRLEFDVRIAHDLYIPIDKSRILYIVFNLVNNAIKHNTGADVVRVCVAAKVYPATRTGFYELRIYVADDGCGLPDDIAHAVNSVKGVELYESQAVDPGRQSKRGLPLVKALLSSYRFDGNEPASIRAWNRDDAGAAAMRSGFPEPVGAIFELIFPVPTTSI